MMITVNGTRREMPAGATVAMLVASMREVPHGRGLAVALGGEVVPRSAWADTALSEEAAVEVLTAVQGG
jgi:sulfur carrier protein